MALVLMRRVDEIVVLDVAGYRIEIMVCGVGRGRAYLRFVAPREVRIMRAELLCREPPETVYNAGECGGSASMTDQNVSAWAQRATGGRDYVGGDTSTGWYRGYGTVVEFTAELQARINSLEAEVAALREQLLSRGEERSIPAERGPGPEEGEPPGKGSPAKRGVST